MKLPLGAPLKQEQQEIIVKVHIDVRNLFWEICFVLDPYGQKMSKSKGNVIDPHGLMEMFGADAVRFWAGSSKLGEDVAYQEKDVTTGHKTITKLYNASRFLKMHLKEKPKTD